MKILDVCCGSRMFWYDKHEEHTTYMDIRKAVYKATDREKERRIEINPDIQADWKHIPFDDCIEEYMVGANTKKEAVKKFRQILNENNAILNFHVQVYSPDWWNVYRYPLEKLELMRFGGETTMPCKIWRDANE